MFQNVFSKYIYENFTFFSEAVNKNNIQILLMFSVGFSYLDQFYTSSPAILISLFYYNVYPSHGQFLRFLLCIFYRNKFSLLRTPI